MGKPARYVWISLCGPSAILSSLRDMCGYLCVGPLLYYQACAICVDISLWALSYIIKPARYVWISLCGPSPILSSLRDMCGYPSVGPLLYYQACAICVDISLWALSYIIKPAR